MATQGIKTKSTKLWHDMTQAERESVEQYCKVAAPDCQPVDKFTANWDFDRKGRAGLIVGYV